MALDRAQMRRTVPLLGTALLLAFGSGCGGEGLRDSGQASATTTASPTDEAAGAALGLAEVRRAKEPAVRQVLSALRHVQLGAWPLVVQAYHPKVQSSVGVARIIEALASQRTTVQAAEISVVDTEETALGQLVTVVLKSSENPNLTASFLMVEEDGRTLIAYDSLLGDSIAYQVQAAVQQQIDPSAKTASRQAVAAGREAAQEYWELFADEQRASSPGE